MSTLGESRIRTTFNPGNNDKVQNLKEKFAHLYNDLLNVLPDKKDSSEEAIEARRCMDKSLNLLEESAMFAVKSVTSR